MSVLAHLPFLNSQTQIYKLYNKGTSLNFNINLILMLIKFNSIEMLIFYPGVAVENVWTEKVQRDPCHLESRRQIVGERAARGAPQEDPPWGGGLH